MRRGSRGHRVSRVARPTALLSAVVTLLGALFLCLSPSGPVSHHGAAEQQRHGVTAVDGHGADRGPAFTCPYDRGDCGLMPVLNPAVLTAPPLDAPLQAASEPPYTVPPAAPGGPRRSGALPRAPDLHVLQVLRA
ncbi:hypothetical protein [Streptomyces sp. NPDC005805]|uniref:hypothetical protein n=1 Tax=Streptomyces sp. NPDC005805 TaxID=3157068 RepID=UPI0033C2DAF6